MSDLDKTMRRLGSFPLGDSERHKPIDSDLKRFEDNLGGRLPADYREFLLSYGATALNPPAIFTVPSPSPFGDEGTVEEFFGLSALPDEGIENATFDTFAGRIPDEAIPIGGDSAGNLVLLGYDGFAAGNVWLWDHEHAELADSMDEIRSDLEARGVDLRPLDDHAAIWTWERLFPEKREGRALGHSNLYLVADSFSDWLQSLKPDPRYVHDR